MHMYWLMTILDILGCIYKNDAFKTFKIFSKRVQKEKDCCISSIRSDHGTEFENEFFKTFYNENGISHTFSSSRTP